MMHQIQPRLCVLYVCMLAEWNMGVCDYSSPIMTKSTDATDQNSSRLYLVLCEAAADRARLLGAQVQGQVLLQLRRRTAFRKDSTGLDYSFAELHSAADASLTRVPLFCARDDEACCCPRSQTTGKCAVFTPAVPIYPARARPLLPCLHGIFAVNPPCP